MDKENIINAAKIPITTPTENLDNRLSIEKTISILLQTLIWGMKKSLPPKEGASSGDEKECENLNQTIKSETSGHGNYEMDIS